MVVCVHSNMLKVIPNNGIKQTNNVPYSTSAMKERKKCSFGILSSTVDILTGALFFLVFFFIMQSSPE